MRIHKVEAAQRQLDTAISLFFADGDLCSVITLAAASEEVLGNYVDGAWSNKNENSIFARMFSSAKQRGLRYRTKKEFSQELVNATKNALKHANNEEEQYISFDEEEAVIKLMSALFNYQIGSGLHLSTPMLQFEEWLRKNRAHYL